MTTTAITALRIFLAVFFFLPTDFFGGVAGVGASEMGASGVATTVFSSLMLHPPFYPCGRAGDPAEMTI